MKELSKNEQISINGGDGFAHDVGKGLRFGWIYVTRGAGAAIADHFANGIKCGC